MIISHKYRFLFVEVPHTASHSISEQLIAHYGGEPILRKHANVTQFLGMASAAEKSYFRFATVRNPLDSATTDFSKLKGNHKEQFTNPAMLIENGGHVTADHLREFKFIQDNDADFSVFFAQFRNRLYNNWFLIGDRNYDFVIRFEDLQSGFSRVLDKLGVEQAESVPHVNRTKAKKGSYLDFYTSDIYQQAVRCYGPFMRKWGYQIPDSWGDIKIPRFSQVQFSMIDGVAQIASRFMPMNPDNPFIRRAKKTVDWVTGDL